jgi:hypothetical protein
MAGLGAYGTVFEITKTASGYLTPTVLASFDGPNGGNTAGSNGSVPKSNLIMDAAGDLFGTTSGWGPGGYGTVFEIKKTSTGYSTITLAGFNRSNGAGPVAGLVTDSAGDLFGTTSGGGTSLYGTVFEIAKATTATGYATTPTTLVNFSYANGAGIYPLGSLITDAAGDLFGTTSGGGITNGVNDDYGTVFEIKKTAGGYSPAATTLVSFNGADGSGPAASLIADATGDLFGTTTGGGMNYGTVFEIAKTSTGYASTPSTLAKFNVTNGNAPQARLTADAAGDLFGTTEGGGSGAYGTVFELTNSGFVTNAVAAGTTWTVSGAVVAPTLLDNGTVSIAAGGKLDVSSSVVTASSGVFALSAQSELEIASCLGSSAKIQFLGGRALLAIDTVAQFGLQAGSGPYAGPLIEGFTASDAIDLKGMGSLGLGFSYSATSGDCQITHGGSVVATLAFQNSTLGPGVFSLASDGSGGTILAHG